MESMNWEQCSVVNFFLPSWEFFCRFSTHITSRASPKIFLPKTFKLLIMLKKSKHVFRDSDILRGGMTALYKSLILEL